MPYTRQQVAKLCYEHRSSDCMQRYFGDSSEAEIALFLTFSNRPPFLPATKPHSIINLAIELDDYDLLEYMLIEKEFGLTWADIVKIVDGKKEMMKRLLEEPHHLECMLMLTAVRLPIASDVKLNLINIIYAKMQSELEEAMAVTEEWGDYIRKLAKEGFLLNFIGGTLATKDPILIDWFKNERQCIPHINQDQVTAKFNEYSS